MASVKEKVRAEMENIAKVLAELEKVKDRPNKELVVLVGMGAFLQNIYTGMENILKQLLQHEKVPVPGTPTWHRDLLNLATERGFITRGIAEQMGKYLSFRHFFAHAYGFLIEEVKLKPLVRDISRVYSEFKREVDTYLSKL
jgi:uncharacterized protein YutE (UPF0331/DUF86 family)